MITLFSVLRTVGRLGEDGLDLATFFRGDFERTVDGLVALLAVDVEFFFTAFVNAVVRLVADFEGFFTTFFLATVRLVITFALFFFAAILTVAGSCLVAVLRLADVLAYCSCGALEGDLL